MTENEIKEAIIATKEVSRWLKGDGNGRHYDVLVSLAEEYLKIKGWPEERCFYKRDFNNERLYDRAKQVEEGFNQALRRCKLAAMKEKTGMKENTQEA